MSVTAAMTIDEHTTINSENNVPNNDTGAVVVVAALHKLQKQPPQSAVNSATAEIIVVPAPTSPIQNSSSASTTSPPASAASATAAAASVEQQCRLLEDENQSLKIEQSRLQQQCSDAQRREKIFMRRLANKEQEFQDYVSQIAEYKAAQAPGPAALRSALLDPAVNLLFEKLKKELQATKSKLEDTQNELAAWKFTPDSNTGKRLMAKCRLLYQENEELGKMTSNGRLAKLEGELAMQKSFCEEVKKSQSELDDYLQEIDEDVEGMQSTILFLQQELKATRDRIQYLEKENVHLKKSAPIDDTIDTVPTNNMLNGSSKDQPMSSPQHHLPTIKENEEYQSSKDSHVNSNSETYNGNSIGSKNGLSVGVDDELSANSNSAAVVGKRLRKRNYDSDSSECGSVNGSAVSSAPIAGARGSSKKIKKQTRRASSVLSLDLNEEDTQITGEPSDDDESSSANSRIVTRRKSARNQPQNGDIKN